MALFAVSATAGTIGTTAVTPPSVATGVASSVTVTAVIADPTVIAGSVQLQSLDINGRVTGVVGALHDDGLNGDAVANDGTYTLQATVLQNSPGTVTYRVSAGFQGSLLLALSSPMTVTVTGSSVSINILTPANLLYTNTSPVSVTGTVGDPNAKVVINGINAPVTSGKFLATVPLVEGLNTLTAVATNTSGTASTASVQVTLDTTPPHITIDSPQAGMTTTASSITVTGTANDIVVGTVNTGDVTVVVNGVTAQVANRTYAAANIPLVLGANTIQAVGHDRAGNGTTVTATITRMNSSQPLVTSIGMPVVMDSLNLVSGNNQTGTIGQALGAPLVVALTDQNGKAVAGQPVVFTVTGNNGTVMTGGTPAPSVMATTDSNGKAQAIWTLGQRSGAGINTVQVASSLAVGPVSFNAAGLTSGASAIVVDSGNNQSGALGQALAFPFVAVVMDSGHNRVPNIAVTFEVTQGGGTLNGALTQQVMSDSNGRAIVVLTLGTQPGNSNNVVQASFAGNPGLPVSFAASGLTPGNPANTTISGLVVDNSNNPIQGATMRLYQTNQASNNNLPLQIGTPVQTDVNGMFTITSAPVGYFKLMADGSTAVGGKSYPTVEFDIVTVAGQNNTLGMPISLPTLDTVNQLCVDATHGGTLTLPASPGFSLTVAAGSATFPGGSQTGCISVSAVNPDKVPMAPGFGQQPHFIVTIQPVGTVFNPPAPITIPNADGLKPGAVTEMYSYDHDLSMFVAIGTGTVSADGSVIASNPGVGVLKAGWHCGGDPDSSGTVASCPTCQMCQAGACVPVPDQKGDVTGSVSIDLANGESNTFTNGLITAFLGFIDPSLITKSVTLKLSGSIYNSQTCCIDTGNPVGATTEELTLEAGGDIKIPLLGPAYLQSVVAKVASYVPGYGPDIASFINDELVLGIFFSVGASGGGGVSFTQSSCPSKPTSVAGLMNASLDFTLSADAKLADTKFISGSIGLKSGVDCHWTTSLSSDGVHFANTPPCEWAGLTLSANIDLFDGVIETEVSYQLISPAELGDFSFSIPLPGNGQ